ncbi:MULTISPECIES: hypothetical protein [Thermoactinomyces]|jgi:hypothetical protein|uniref:Uncharacterized protein n=1 Tax=Thermoactinomyces daqus TaxID=1329516 RepID=A0A7W1XAX3_9BACL|nr:MULTISPECIES: hypothetical protein [Thermoactinomyces]MBA4543234.1 hypothetical protein [Thermoactinomyces daqus]MBH8597733.1 hypothetical protein [Thermoactinomyces sp. CICC 10523]MBH8604075.1 hypothetical protein [Thermoactinomyces sp. CICC 10522]MBH8606390.1 hypothetical protein [Thermoactinomyces sp. CICC 10521]
MYYGYPYYSPYTISTARREHKNEDMSQMITRHMSIAEEIQRRISSIDERFGRIEKMIQERLK